MDVAIVEFISASSAATVYVELGFVPDFAILIQNHGGTNPNLHYWLNNDKFSGWAAALSLLHTGATGVLTRNATGITKYAGNETIATNETDNTSGKHITRTGAAGVAGHVTAPGLTLPAGVQTNSGRNVLVAFKNDL
jgi:hypothetical protein